MATVSQMKNDSWFVLWSFDLAVNGTGSTTFNCTDRKLTFRLAYAYTATDSTGRLISNPTLSANLKAVETSLPDHDYPGHVTAILDGMTKVMKQSKKGEWGGANWTYSRPQEYDRSRGTYSNKSSHLLLILEFPQTAQLYLVNQFTNLLESQAMADVTFIVKGQEMAAHAAILAAASPVMTAMLEPGKFKEGQSKTVEINDIEPEVFQQLLRYVYTGTAPKLDDETITEPLFLAADKYQMDKIKERCEESLIRKLSLDNAVRYLVMAHLHSAGRLQEASIQFLVGCRKEIWDRPDWKKLIDTYPELFYLASRRMVKNT